MAKLKLIQCGVGGMGQTWWNGATNQSDDFDLVAIVDPAEKALTHAGDALALPAAQRFASLPAALDAIEVDAVLTVTPPAVHVEHARLAFSRGLHLLTEKPIAPTLAEAREMVDLADRAKRQLVVAQNYRYSAVMAKLALLFREQPLGAFGHGHIDFYIPADFTGSFREAMPYVLLVDMSIHHLDLIRAVTGLDITRMTANAFRPAWSWYKGQSALKLMMELTGGVPFTYSGDWSGPGSTTTWNGSWRLQFENGSINVENDKIAIHRCERWGKNPVVETIDIPAATRNPQAELLARFADAIRTDTPAATSGRDNLKSFGAVTAAIESSERGEWISMHA